MLIILQTVCHGKSFFSAVWPLVHWFLLKLQKSKDIGRIFVKKFAYGSQTELFLSLPGRNEMKLGMTFVYMRIITHDDLEKNSRRKL